MLLKSQISNPINNNSNYNRNPNIKLYKKLIEEEHKKDPKYKTELCKTFSETGKCPYGFKCRFAHGKEELSKKTLF